MTVGMKCIIAADHGMLRKGLSELLRSIEPALIVVEMITFTALLDQLFREPDTDLVLPDLIAVGMSNKEIGVELGSS